MGPNGHRGINKAWLNNIILLRRKNKHLDNYNHALCNDNIEETSFHLFFHCPSSVGPLELSDTV
jgi:hypothetical protein